MKIALIKSARTKDLVYGIERGKRIKLLLKINLYQQVARREGCEIANNHGALSSMPCYQRRNYPQIKPVLEFLTTLLIAFVHNELWTPHTITMAKL